MVACLPLNYIVMDMYNVFLLYLTTFGIGFFLSPLVPLLFELSCEIVYPLSGSFAIGVLYSGSTILAAVNS